MAAVILPETTIKTITEDATAEGVCFEYAAKVLGDPRKAGKLRGYVEATLDTNPGLAAAGAVLPLGMTLTLPEFTVIDEQTSVRLWD